MDICLFYLNVVFCIARFRFPEGTTCSCSPFSMNFFCLAADARSLTTWNDSPRHSSIHRRSGKNCTSVENSFRKSLDFSVGKMRREAWRTFFSHVWNKGCPVHDPNVAGNHGFYNKKNVGLLHMFISWPTGQGSNKGVLVGDRSSQGLEILRLKHSCIQGVGLIFQCGL